MVGLLLENRPDLYQATPMKHWPLRIFGIACIVIGLWLMHGLLPAFGEMLSQANTQREAKGVWSMLMAGVLLIAFGAVAVWRPEWLKNA